MYKLPKGYQAHDHLDGIQLEFDYGPDATGEMMYDYGAEGEVLPRAVAESLRALRKREGCCEGCGTKLPMTWMGLGACPRCKNEN